MAGKALKRRLLAVIEERGGPEYVGEYIATGGTILDLAEELGCSRTYLSRHLNAHPAYKPVIDDARREQADTLAEEALQIADGLADADAPTRESIAVAKERIDVRKWLASVNHPDRYQQNKNGPTVTININQLHLDALKKRRDGNLTIDVTPDAAATEEPDDDE
jgi:AraC-like DNA-binding protein